jgi:P27 family predicted phage terminase small subunit
MRGPLPKPTHLRVLEGNPSKRPLNRNEPKPPPVETLDSPDYLSGYARAEWIRIVPGLCAMRLLTSADIPALGLYCVAYSRWREAEEALARFRANDPATHGLIVDGRTNPLVGIASNAGRDMLRFAAEFGMSPAARTRISLGIGPLGPSKFAGLLDDGGDRTG